jgi:predicted outer membrane protein
VLVADTLLGGSIDPADVALAFLADPDALAFAEEIADEYGAARDTLAALAEAISATPADSDVAGGVRTANDDALQELVGTDAGASDALFMSAQVAAHTRALALLEQLIVAADAPALRAQLVVLQALEQVNLERARTVAANL